MEAGGLRVGLHKQERWDWLMFRQTLIYRLRNKLMFSRKLWKRQKGASSLSDRIRCFLCYCVERDREGDRKYPFPKGWKRFAQVEGYFCLCRTQQPAISPVRKWASHHRISQERSWWGTKSFQVRCVQLTEDWLLVPLQKNRGCPTKRCETAPCSFVRDQAL